MQEKMLEDGGLRLRAPEPADVDALFRLENDEALWTVSCNSAPYSRAQLSRYVDESVHDLFAEHQIRLIIELDGVVAGCIDLSDVDAVQSRAQVGIALLNEFRGRGVALSALEKICTYAEHRLRLRQLYALVPVDNNASLCLFESCGFDRSGLLREWLWGGDVFSDVVILQKIFQKKMYQCL